MSYYKKGYSVIPVVHRRKNPCIEGWSDFNSNLPSLGEMKAWGDKYLSSGIGVCTGSASGIIALDYDTSGVEEIDNYVEQLLVQFISPVEKIGNKGWTRFFQYNNEASRSISVKGHHYLDLLSVGKFCVLPPSIHPKGKEYRYKDEIGLLDVGMQDLPVLPMGSIDRLENAVNEKFSNITKAKDVSRSNSTRTKGRNTHLKHFVSKLIFKRVPKMECAYRLAEEDSKSFPDNPYFSDRKECRLFTDDPLENSGIFYDQIFKSIERDSSKEVVPVFTGGTSNV